MHFHKTQYYMLTSMLGIILILTKKQKRSFIMKKIICLLIIMSFAGFAMAHWNVGDVHKMGGNGP